MKAMPDKLKRQSNNILKKIEFFEKTLLCKILCVYMCACFSMDICIYKHLIYI